MQSPSLSTNDYLPLINNIFKNELSAIISSKDYKSQYANLSREEKKLLKKNIIELAEFAAKYFISKKGEHIKDENKLKDLITKSVFQALENLNDFK